MIWNYQLGFKKEGEDTLYGVVEVYRNSSGDITFTTENFVDANHYGDEEEVKLALKRMLEDCEHYPVLNLDTITYADLSREDW